MTLSGHAGYETLRNSWIFLADKVRTLRSSGGGRENLFHPQLTKESELICCSFLPNGFLSFKSAATDQYELTIHDLLIAEILVRARAFVYPRFDSRRREMLLYQAIPPSPATHLISCFTLAHCICCSRYIDYNCSALLDCGTSQIPSRSKARSSYPLQG